MNHLRSLPALLAAPVTLVTEAAASSFTRSVSLTVVARLVGIALGALTLTLTTRLLGPVGRGQYAVVMTTVALVLQFSHFGLHASSVHFLARRPEARAEVGALLLWFSLGVTSAIALGTFGLGALMPALLGAVPLEILGLGLLAAPPAMFVLLAGNALLGLGSARWFNGLELAGRLVALLAAGLLFWWSLSSHFLAYAAFTCVPAALAYARLLGHTAPRAPRRRLAAAMLGYGLRAFLSALLMFLILRVGLFLLNALSGAAAAGLYSVALNVAEIMTLAAASINAILFQRLSTMAAEARWVATKRVATVTGVGLGFIAVGLALGGRSLFQAWFGADFEIAVLALWWLLPGMWCLGVSSVLYQYLAASGMPWFVVAAPAAGVVTAVALSVVTIPAFGMSGAAAALSATCALMLVLSVIYVRSYADTENRW